MSDQLTLPGMPSAISSQEFQAGPSPSKSPDGPTINQSGQVRAPARASRRRANGAAATIPGICGQSSADSLQNASLLWSSASKSLPQTPSGRLQARLGAAIIRRLQPHGSMEYRQAWKVRATPSGFTFLAHTASARRTSGSGCTGWPTATVNDATGSGYAYARGNHDKPVLKLPGAAQLSGWPTPNAMEGGSTSRGGDRKNELLMGGLVGWPTPNVPTRGAESRESKDNRGVADTLSAQVGQDLTRGPTSSSSPAATERRGVLNPAFPLWLMGFPATWQTCCPGWKSWDTIQKLLAESSEKPAGTE